MMRTVLRWLIRLYPEDFRRAHEKDLLRFYGDPSDASRSDEGEPGLRDVLDLIMGAIGVRSDRALESLNGWRREMGGSVLSDVRYAIRSLLRTPGFTAMAVITLALGLGANTALFSVVQGVLLRSLPYPDAQELVAVPTRFLPVSGFDFPRFSVDPTEYSDYRDDNRSMEAVAAYYGTYLTVTGSEGEAERVLTLVTTWNLFEVLSAEATLGRTLTPEDDRPDGPFVVVLSHDFWSTRFGSDPAILGKTLTLNGNPAQVVGVMPEGFAYPQPDVKLWTALQLDPANLGNRQSHYLRVVGRLQDGVTLESAKTEMATMMAQWEASFPDIHTGHFMFLEPLLESQVRTVRSALLLLMGAVGFLLLIVCANMANLVLVRGQARLKEVAVRRALGASRARLVQLGLTESLVLTLGSALLGVLLASGAVPLLLSLQRGALPRTEEVGLNGTVLLFTAALAIVTAFAFGLVPAWQNAGPDSGHHLHEDGRTRTAGPRRLRVRSALVAGEVALSILLVVGAALVTKSFWRLLREDPGFDTEGALVASLSLPSADYPSAEEATQFFAELVGRLEALPGVEAVTHTNRLPMGESLSVIDFQVEGLPEPGPGQPTWNAAVSTVRHNYFQTMGMRLVRGRFFDETDRPESAPSMVISESLADKFFQGRDPIGMRMGFSGGSIWFNIVGVVSNVDQASLGDEGNPMYYFDYEQVPGVVATLGTGRARAATLILRTSGDPGSLAPLLRTAVADLDANLPVTGIRTLEDVVSESVAQPRFIMTLMAVFAALSLVLGAVGIYGVTSFVVSQRGHEIGVRKALGAKRQEVVGMVLGQGMVPIAIGVAVGLLGAAAGGRVMDGLLYEVDAADPLTFGSVALVLGAVGLLASWLPAQRAARVDPSAALRND